MGYVIGGKVKSQIIKSASESDFNEARNFNISNIPSISPVRSMGKFNKDNIESIKKNASGMDISSVSPTYNDPRYSSTTLSIPTDERSLHGLYRFFAETDPIVGAGLRIHGELPLSDMRLGQCEDSGVQAHFEEMWEERINGTKLLNDIAYELFEIGNVFPFGAFNEADYMWDQFAILNPDYVKVESTWINQKPLIKLLPDEALRRVVQTQSPRFVFEQLPPEIVSYILFNQEIPLDPNNVFHLAYAKRPYENKGKSIIKRILKPLMLEDRLNQANYALATRHSVPLTVVKVGDPNTGWIPDQTELESVRDMFSNYEYDPNFSIFYHYGIDVVYYGSNGKMLPIGPELDRIYRLKFIGLGIHEQLLTGNGGSYASAYISMEVQRQRYLNLQLKIENFVHNGIFKPVADMCGFYRVRKSVSSAAYSSKYSYGNRDDFTKQVLSQYKNVRDYKDNSEFIEYVKRKTAEKQVLANKEVKEYVYPRLDFGALSAAYDENMKNYIKWLAEKRPHLVDDALLARMGKLNRDDQIRSFEKDLQRNKDLYFRLKNKGLLEFLNGKNGLFDGKNNASGGDIGGMGLGGGDLGGESMPDLGGGGDFMEGPPINTGEPNAPIGENAPPENASGTNPPVGAAALEKEISLSVVGDDVNTVSENRQMLLKNGNLIKNEIKKLIGIETWRE